MDKTFKEEAEALVNKFLSIKDSQSRDGSNLMFQPEAKKCAIICVEEMTKALQDNVDLQNMERVFVYYDNLLDEIEKL